MTQNAYQSPDSESSVVRPWLPALAGIGSVVLMLLGVAVAGLGTQAADGRRFFFIGGGHLFVSGAAGALFVWAMNDRIRQRVRVLYGRRLCWH